MSTVVERRKFVCVEFGETNNNKVWQFTVYDDDTAFIEWGRIGRISGNQTKTKAHAYKKMREKTNPNNTPDKLYSEVKAKDTGGDQPKTNVRNSNLADIAKKQIRATNPITQSLIEYLVRVNAHQITQATGGRITFDTSTATFQTPLGVIDPVQVSEARNLLAQIADLVRYDSHDSGAFPTLLNQYLRLIPHDVGMSKISPYLIFPDFAAVQSENDLLDGLDASFTEITTAPKKKTKKKAKKDTTPQIFNVELAIVEDDAIISMIRKMYQETRKAQHTSNNLSVKTIYKVDIATMTEAFKKYGAKLSNHKKLWHGTKASNLLSIMRKGLIIPAESSSHCTGRMFGNGVYFSSISTKALNYATNTWGSGGDISRTFMFLAVVAMGDMHIRTTSGWGESFPKNGSDSTWAKAGGALHNPEMIVYRLDQANLLYLVEFCSRGSY